MSYAFDEYYRATHEMLIRDDPFFLNFWLGLSESRRSSIVDLWEQFQRFCMVNHGSMDVLNEEFYRTTRSYFVRVQEKEFEYSRVRNDWYYFIRDEANLRRLYAESLKRIASFFDDLAVEFYGSIKSESSIHKKIIHGDEARKDEKVRPQAFDIWDVVRFRMVFGNLMQLREAAVLFWEKFVDDVVRCRNYYYRSKDLANMDPYRAIHFELADAFGRIVELQMMTRNREAIALVDHAFVFKANIKFRDDGHRDWLSKCSIAANVLDARDVELL